ncbi:phosphotransferase family protein [Aquisalibacillus elongatus]|uniref:Thiamine kinase-like enzyme n=1 Tax=Aquisalibacillus elongatus TaxID=485577 RepID=A0A3N5BCU9_9BACI|nr:phosphotransferase family protein [Aquisalibacillus elongatus]RPF55303.1 thiamine kinase-like enzyme [Aquisalibacillus elongatus]
MEHVLGSEWSISPAGGTTGEAFLAEKQNEKLFLKRNSSPFLAVLSAEGIVPKLVWTKRLENGDVITAQKWLEGRVLSKNEMKEQKVAKLLSKIHHSSEILHLFMRMGKKPLEPANLLVRLINQYRGNQRVDQALIAHALEFLHKHLEQVKTPERVVCHSDLNHENWLQGEDDHLYLIDWDQAVIADPALDLSLLLYQYVPREQWDEWLEQYGVTLTHNLHMRIQWYMIALSLSYYIWYLEQDHDEYAMKWKERLMEHKMAIYS